MKRMRLARAWTFVAVLAVLASCAPVLSCLANGYDETFTKNPVRLPSHRLPKHVMPTLYKIDLDLTGFNAESEPLSRVRFSGSVNVTVHFMHNGASASSSSGSSSSSLRGYVGMIMSPRGLSNKILMHADNSLRINRVRVYTMESDGAGQPRRKQLRIRKTQIDRRRQIIVLSMAEDLPVDQTGVVMFEYSGDTSRDLRGLFVTGFSDQIRVYPQLVAKFRPAFARLVLPCFDEPSFKARFSLTLRHRNDLTALANTDRESFVSERTVTASTFEETPPVPIHMVAFIVAQFDQRPLTRNRNGELMVRSYTPPGYANQGRLALEVAVKAIVWFEKFIDFPFPSRKMDLVAVGDMDTDNTEAWGLAFVKHNLLLFNVESMPDSGISTAVNVAHVVVHQWFGNLVTAEWWSELWITEMVAAQMAFEFVAEKYPLYQSEHFVRISTLSDVLSQDSLSEGHALAPSEDQLSSSDGVSVLFDNITFMKSAALARLLQNMLGREWFCAALSTLVRNHCHSNVNFDNLVEAISAHNTRNADMRPFIDILKSWSTLASYPVINVDLDLGTNNVIVYQERVYDACGETAISPNPSEYKNYVSMPLKILVSDAVGMQHSTMHVKFILGRGGVVKKLPLWFNPSEHYIKVSPNPDISTYYRIRYSDDLLELLRAPIESKQIPPMERLHILNDANALVNSQLLKTDTFKELLSWHANEDDWTMIMQMFIATKTLMLLSPTEPSPLNIERVSKKVFLKHLFRERGDESFLEQRARMITLRSLVDQSDQEAIKAALNVFEAQAANGAALSRLAPFLRDPVYAAVVYVGNFEQQWALVDHMDRTNSYEERLRLAKNLVLTEDLYVLARLVKNLNTFHFKKSTLQAMVETNPLLELGEDGIVYTRRGF